MRTKNIKNLVRQFLLRQEGTMRAVGQDQLAECLFGVWRQDINRTSGEEIDDVVHQFRELSALGCILGGVPVTNVVTVCWIACYYKH